MKLTRYELSNVTKFVDSEIKAKKLEALGFKKVDEIEEIKEDKEEKEDKKENKKNTKGE